MNKIKIDNYYKPESKTLRLDEVDYTIIPNSDIKPLIDKLQQENKQLKEENKELKHWKELHSCSILAKQNIKLFNQQDDFIKYMEGKIEKELDELDTLCELNKISRNDNV